MRARGFAILLLYLHTYIIHDHELTGLLEDLLECWDRLNATKKAHKKKASGKSKKKADHHMEIEETSEEPEPMSVLVDILISLLTKPSSQLRDLVTRIFRLFASQMTSSSCQALVEVVTGKRDSTLFGPEGEEEDDDDEEDIEEEGDGEENADENEQDKEEDEPSEEDDDDESEEQDINDALLRSHSSKEDDDEEEELLDDEACFKRAHSAVHESC